MQNVLTLTHRGTHFYLLDVTGGKLMVDAGWPGSLPVVARQLKAYRLDGAQIKYVLPTHLHPDHAGLVQELKQAWGTRLIIHEQQLPFLPELEAFYARKGGYVPIRVDPSDLVLSTTNRGRWQQLGVAGEFIATPGHSDDSFSLVLDSGAAFIGDLPLPHLVDETKAPTVRASWQTLADRGVRNLYPSHTTPIAMEAVSPYLAIGD